MPSVSESQDHLPNNIAEDVLRKYFLLTDDDMIEVERCCGSGNRLGFAVQLCTLRWRGHFLPDTRSLPQSVLETLAPQLGVLAMQIPDYPQNEKTRWEHQERIRRHLGFSKCDEAQRERLFAHLRSQVVITPRTQALSAEAVRWLIERRIVRPGQTTLREIVGMAKEAALQQVYEQISSALGVIQQQLLDELLKAEPIIDATTGLTTTPRSRLEQFKLLPRRESPVAMAALTMRLTEIQAVGFSNLSILQQVHSATRALLASWGYRYDVRSLRRFAAPKRYSLVLAFLQAALAETLDAIIEMQDKLITKVHNNARERREEVLRAAEQARTRAKEGKLRGREFEDQLHSFSCLAILHNAVVAWNLKHIALLIEQLRAEGHIISDEDLALTSPLVRRHINPYGRYHFDLTSFKRVSMSEGLTEA